MGARAACAVAYKVGDNHMCVGVVAFSYPLHTETNISKLRDELLIELDEASVPLLLISGTRDSMCSLDVLANVRSRMRMGLHRLVKIYNATHSGAIKGGKVVNDKLEIVITRFVVSWVETLARGEGRWKSHEPCVKVENKDMVVEWEPLDQYVVEEKKKVDTLEKNDIEVRAPKSEIKLVETKRRSSRKRKAA